MSISHRPHWSWIGNKGSKQGEKKRDIREPKSDEDRSHRSLWWLPRRSSERGWNGPSLWAVTTPSASASWLRKRQSLGRRRRGWLPSNCLSNRFPPFFYHDQRTFLLWLELMRDWWTEGEKEEMRTERLSTLSHSVTMWHNVTCSLSPRLDYIFVFSHAFKHFGLPF